MLFRVNTEDYICDKLLELMEKKPFEKIKIVELVEYAEIGRSTFYSYFDSIYAVVQRIEDKFIEGLAKEDKADPTKYIYSGFDAETNSALRSWVEYTHGNLKTLKILCGPNGDPAFEVRITNRLRRQTEALIKKFNPNAAQKDISLVSSYVAGGIAASLKWWANHADDYTDSELLSFAIVEGRQSIEFLKSMQGRKS